MGYRLEVSKLEYTDCGGKLFGYIDEDDLHTCKSWKWLKNHGYLTSRNKDWWNCGIRHDIILDNENFRKFITLYIEDYNRLSPYGSTLSLDDFKESLAADRVLIQWF